MSDYSERKKKNRKQLTLIHTPAVVQRRGGGGGGGMEPIAGVCNIFLILPLVQSQFSSS